MLLFFIKIEKIICTILNAVDSFGVYVQTVNRYEIEAMVYGNEKNDNGKSESNNNDKKAIVDCVVNQTKLLNKLSEGGVPLFYEGDIEDIDAVCEHAKEYVSEVFKNRH